MEKTGKRAVGCFPLYTPDELVDATGILPVGMWAVRESHPGRDNISSRFLCSRNESKHVPGAGRSL